jgi:HEXXH motif-containing protein
MSANSHQLPRETFTALASGGGGPSAIRLLSDISFSKLLLLIVGVLRRSQGAPSAERGYELLATVQEKAPDDVGTVLRHPSVRAWARHASQALAAGSSDPDVERLGVLAAAAAIRAGVPCAVEVPAPGGVLTLPSLGRALLRRERAMIDVASDGAEIRCLPGAPVAPSTGAGTAVDRLALPADPHEDARGWRGLRRLSAVSAGSRLELLIDDVDPYRMPAMPNLAQPMTDEQIRQWQSVLDPAWDILVRRHPTTADEVRTALRVVTPLRPPAHGQISATGRDTFGCIAMSAPTDPQSFAETLAHEVGHAKLTGLLDIAQLTLPDDGSRYYAPWRDDPRPASGLLQGVYAYLGVTGFWRRERIHGASGHADSEFARWRAAARLGADTLLAGGRLTGAGEEFVSGVRATLLEWEHDTVPTAAMARAVSDNERHRTAWRKANGELSTAG